MPGRHLNDTERRLQERWASTFGPRLQSIEICAGTPLRGLSAVTLDLRYPLAVVAGKNGTGKSTFLACAACAYRNSGDYESLFFKKKYFNFSDVIVNSRIDSSLDNVTVQWTYRLSNRDIAIASASKGESRWSGYRKRPERAVEFLGLMRALHPTEYRVLRDYFGERLPVNPVSLGNSSTTLVSSVLARSYDDVQCATKGRYSLHVLNAQGAQYSGFHAGSGEDITCLLSRVLEQLPESSLLIIEELETGLHPAAQRHLVEKLLELCLSKRLQVICSSHSRTVLTAVPAEARVLLVRCGASVQPRYGVSVEEAVSEMTEVPEIELCVYVEDDVAKYIVLESLSAEIRKRVHIVTCGCWDDVIRFLSIFRRDPSLGNAVGILDGERSGNDGEHRGSLNRYMGGHATDEDWTWLSERLCCLPGGTPPEALFCQFGREQDYCGLVAGELKAQPQMIIDFFASYAGDAHDLPHELAQRVGHGEERIIVALARASYAHRADEFRRIESFIARRIAEGAR